MNHDICTSYRCASPITWAAKHRLFRAVGYNVHEATVDERDTAATARDAYRMAAAKCPAGRSEVAA